MVFQFFERRIFTTRKVSGSEIVIWAEAEDEKRREGGENKKEPKFKKSRQDKGFYFYMFC